MNQDLNTGLVTILAFSFHRTSQDSMKSSLHSWCGCGFVLTKWSLRGADPRVLKCKVLKVALLLLTSSNHVAVELSKQVFFPEKSDILPAAQWPWPVGTPADGALGLRRRWTADDFVTSKSPQRRIPVLSGTLERRIV